MTQTLHIITGTTAVGKTEYALSYAEARDAEIISCDASLVYRGMDIGTAKPGIAERARVPHHLIDLCEVNEPYDIVSYVQDARRAVDGIISRGKSVVITGGSGFYLKSFLAPVVDNLIVPPEVRENVAELFQRRGLPGLLRELGRLNPDGFENLDTKNPRRVMRALERCLASGKTLMALQADFANRPEPYADFAKKVILLERDKEQVDERIHLRTEAMISDGLVEEVRELRRLGIEENPSAASAIGYRESLAFLRGELNRVDLVPAIVQNTIHLAKKQRTWFRTQVSVTERVRL
ncbi:MAG TPA: tRNA (adenosine(37)-N6)-dimethylallyltransferase MiaA [Opitutales bacterium]|nr:tRNA (adenosine(37)-N6)-dimethylallyltransferase MiaA [Opitutales bacterium]